MHCVSRAERSGLTQFGNSSMAAIDSATTTEDGKVMPRAKKVSETPKVDPIAEVNARVEHATAERRKRTNRPFPAAPFEETLSFAQVIYAFGSGQPVRRLSIFDHLQKSPESGHSRQLIINANKYGLIEGSVAQST